MKKRNLIIILTVTEVVVIVSVVIIIAFAVLNNSGINQPVNADNYFNENSEIISEIKAKDSKTVTTEKETLKILKDRGFDRNDITTEYTMNGKYLDSEKIKESSDKKHPMYSTYYTAKSNEVWTVYVINGSVIAYPASYNAESGKETEVIIAENDTLVSYDSVTNKFYETKPKESSVTMKKVEKITKETLDKLTKGAIDTL